MEIRLTSILKRSPAEASGAATPRENDSFRSTKWTYSSLVRGRVTEHLDGVSNLLPPELQAMSSALDHEELFR